MATTLLRRSFRSAFLRTLALAALLAAALLALMNSGVNPQPGPMERSSFKGGAGYWLLGKDGGVFAFGDAKFFGPNRNQGNDIAGMAATASGNGYWTVDDDGDVFAYGDAIDYGSRPGPEIDDIVGFAPRTQGDGYWMVAKNGAVHQFGAAGYFGGANTLKLTKPIVGMAATPSGKGYWLIAGDGGVFAYGDAGFYGSTGNIKLNKPIVDFGPTPDGKGYRFIGNDGGVFAYGDAGFFGSTGAITLNQPIVGFAATATGKGYWLVGEDGGVFSFGDAPFFGSTGAIKLNAPIVAIVATPRIKVPPVANNDTATVAEDASVTVDVKANDTHALPASVSIDTQPAHGTATVSAGKVVYAPTANYNGSDSFKYKLTDTVGHSATASVSVTVTAVNDAPVAGPKSSTTNEDASLISSVSATDVDNDPLTFSKVSDPAHGTVTVNANGTFTYTPAANYNGSDSFTFKASDATAHSNTATVSITVTGTQDLPTIGDVIDRSTAEDNGTGAINVTVGDVDGDTLTLSGSSSNDALVPDANVVVGGSAANPTVTVTPAANLSGTSIITLTVSDGNGGTASDTFVLTVTPSDDPTITDIADQSTERDTATAALNFTIGDADEAAAGLTLSGSSSNTTLVPNGNIVFGGSGANRTVTVTPAPGQSGTATITVTVTDTSSDTASDSFVLTVNDNPTISAMPDVKVSEDTATGALAFTVGDTETLAGNLTVTASSSDQGIVANSGILLGGAGASRTVTITPVTDASGPTTITITVQDGDGGSTSESFTLTVAVNDQPDPQDDDNVSLAVALLGIDVLSNDLGLSDGPITVEIVAGSLPGTEGTAIVTLGNQIQLLTALDGDNDDLISFQYKVTDNDGDFAFGTVTVSLI